MNFVEFINLKGMCKTAAGHKIHNIKTTGLDKQYPIIGKVEWKTGYLMDMSWDENGVPRNLPLNHGLNLIALIPRVEFDVIDISKLD